MLPKGCVNKSEFDKTIIAASIRVIGFSELKDICAKEHEEISHRLSEKRYGVECREYRKNSAGKTPC